jgi:hypothetical protein
MIRAIAIALTLAATGPATAQSIAFAQAPEQSSGIGTGASIDAAIAAARAECVEGGAFAEDCFITTACEWAGWSVDVFAQHEAGNHWHETFCGFDSRATAEAAAAAVCDPETRTELIECAMVQVWDEAGTPQMEW